MIWKIRNNYFDLKNNGYSNGEFITNIKNYINQLIKLFPDDVSLLEIAKDCFENGFQMKDSKQIDNGLKIVNLTNSNRIAPNHNKNHLK